MFQPRYTITDKIAYLLMRVEAIRQEIIDLPITPRVLISLRETARIESTHYSTKIEGNRLTTQEVEQVIYQAHHVKGKERDEKEVLGYYAALEEMNKLVEQKISITESVIKKLHGVIMSAGKKRVKPTPYRDGQNVIKDSSTGKIVYLPPEAHDVHALMKELVSWLGKTENEYLPCPLRAGIAHYQFVTIHPYYDGNGRTARLLTTLILHLGGYDLKGLYSLEEYYAKNLAAYYEALTIGPHNYYFGRAEADITSWVEYFCEGLVESFEKVRNQAVLASEKGEKDLSDALRKLDARKRKVVEYFQKYPSITSQEVGKLFKIKPRTARALCKQWVEEGFLSVAESARKIRKYQLAICISNST